MGTVAKFDINGQEFLPPKEWQDLEVFLDFENDSVQPNINFSTLTFADKANEQLKSWLTTNVGAFEGIPFQISLTDTNNNNQTTYVPFKGYLDWATLKIKSSSQAEIGLVKVDSLNGLFERSQGITMLLLEQKGIMPTSDGTNIPYVIANRNTKLENLYLVYQAFMTLKTTVDEGFKLVSLVAQLPTAGGLIAAVNIVTTLANLVLLFNQLRQQLLAIQDAFFPPIRYHRGIKLKTFLERGCQYMGYTLDTGSFGTLLDKVVLCPHKTDEIGVNIGLFGGNVNNLNTGTSGILKPNDFGYVLSDAFELCNRMFHTKISVVASTVNLRPFNDTFWTNSPAYTMQDVLVEDTSFYQNGTQSLNVDELVGRTLISYRFDDSDKWTISNVNNSISETIVSPTTIINNKHVLIKGLDDVDIPYALCIRTDEIDPLFEKFAVLVNFVDAKIQSIIDVFNTWASVLGVGLGTINSFAVTTEQRASSMKVENHFFSTPKIVYLENGGIPSNFINSIGAIALYNGFHSYKSFVQGIKNPAIPSQTNQKKVFTDVTIPFGATSFNQIINNSFFTDINGNLGKFTNISWKIDRDKAIVSYYIFENYNNNLTQVTL